MIEICFTYHNLVSYNFEFDERCNFLTSLFEKKIHEEGFKIPGIKKISISFVKGTEEELFLLNGSVLLFTSDFTFYNTNIDSIIVSKYERFKVLYNVLTKISSKYNADTKIIDKIYFDCISNGLKNEYYYGNTVESSENDLEACLYGIHSEESFDLYLHIRKISSKKIVSKLLVVKSKTSSYYYSKYICNIKVLKNKFVYQSKDKQLKIEFEFKNILKIV